MPNIRILAQAVGSQVIVLTTFFWPSRKRGITLPYKGRPKKIHVRFFCTDAIYKISSS